MNNDQVTLLSSIASFALSAIVALIVTIIAFALLRRGGIKRFFLGTSGEDNLKDLAEAHNKANQSRTEVEAILRKNHTDPSVMRKK